MNTKQIFYKDGYKYQLEDDCYYRTTLRPTSPVIERFIELSTYGQLTIKSGYSWDGPSGLTIDSKCSMRASLIHDALCQLINDGKLNKKHQPYVDSVLYEICVEDGMWKPRALLWYRAVRRYDTSGLKQYKPKEIMTAP